MTSLNTQGIQTGIHYPIPVHLLPAYSDLRYSPGDFPISEHVASQELSLPMYPELTGAQIDAVGQAIAEFNVCSHSADHLASTQLASVTS